MTKSIPPAGGGYTRFVAEARGGATGDASVDLPRSQTLIAGVWSDLLGHDDFGHDDSFFDLGGDSLFMLKLVSRLEEVGLPLTIDDLLENDTVAKLAAAVSTKGSVR